MRIVNACVQLTEDKTEVSLRLQIRWSKEKLTITLESPNKDIIRQLLELNSPFVTEQAKELLLQRLAELDPPLSPTPQE